MEVTISGAGRADVSAGLDSDATFWRRSLDGDGEAFGQLFDRHRDRVFTHACGRNAARSRRRYRRLLEGLPRAQCEPDVAETSLDRIEFGVNEVLRALRETDAQLLVLVALEGYAVVFASVLRDALVQQVERSGGEAMRRRRRHRRTTTLAVVLVLAGGGGGLAYATGAWTTPPGGNVVTPLARSFTVIGTGSERVFLGRPPAGANSIDIRFGCMSAGSFTYPGGGGTVCGRPGSRWRASAAAARASAGTYTLPVTPGQRSIVVGASVGARWLLIASYSSVRISAWGVNAFGQTYGQQNAHGTPDLVAVIATNGRKGYAYANQLNGPQPTTPAQALALNHAPPITVPVDESDGRTPIGTFTYGGS